MKIQNSKSNIRIDDIKPGTVFSFEGLIYIRIDGVTAKFETLFVPNAVEAHSGVLCSLQPDMIITPIPDAVLCL